MRSGYLLSLILLALSWSVAGVPAHAATPACGISVTSADSGAPSTYQDALARARSASPDCVSIAASLRVAAKNGYAPAENALGEMTESGSIGTADYRQALKLYRQAALSGNPRAEYNIGRMIVDGHAAAEEANLALAPMGSSDTASQAKSAWSTSAVLHSGGAERYAAAALIWKRSADAGDALAQYHLGALYEQGLGVPRDLESARILYRQAAKTLPEAQRALDALGHI